MTTERFDETRPNEGIRLPSIRGNPPSAVHPPSMWFRHLHQVGVPRRGLVAVHRQFRPGLDVHGDGGEVHVPHLVGEVLLHHLLLDQQALGDVPPLVLELHDSLGVPVERRHRRAHTGAERAPRQAEEQKTVSGWSLFALLQQMDSPYA